MRNDRFSFFAIVIAFLSLTFSSSLQAQWHIADTTIQSARDVDFPHPSAAYLTTDMGILYKSIDGGENWTELYNFGVFSSLRNPKFVNKDTGFVFAHPGLHRTFDGGLSWSVIANGSYIQPSSFSVSEDVLVISFQDYTTDTNYIKKSTDLGDTYVTIYEDYNVGIYPFPVSFIDVLSGYVINTNDLEKVFKTTNGGATFDTLQITNGPLHLEKKFEFKDIENGYIFGGSGSQSNPARTWNTGTFYFPIDLDGFGVLPVFDIEFVSANKMYASSLYGKIFLSLNNGQYWTEIETPVTDQVSSIAFSDEMNGIAICENQIIYTKNGDVLGDDDILLEESINLFPNPTQEVIYIESNNKNIKSITIYDLTGKRMRNYDGNHSEINVEDLQKGIYLIKIKMDNNTITKKIVVE